jgi:O-antigen/teichoic acid export membrane protein
MKPMHAPPSLRRFAGVISMLFTGTLAGSALAFLSQIMLARSLDIAEFGRISALLAVVNFFTPVGNAGVNWFVLRVFGAEGWDAVRWLRPAAWLVALATSASCLGFALYIGLSEIASGQAGVILPAGILILIGQVAVELGSSSFQLEDRYGALAAWQVATQAGRFLVILVAGLCSALSEIGILVGYGVLGLALTAIAARSTWALWRKAKARAVTSGSARLGQTLVESSPYALITIFYILYFQGTVAIIAWVGGSAAAAEYNAAFLIFSALSLIPNVIYMKFLAAKLCRWAENDRSAFVAAFHLGVPAMALCGGLIALLLIGTAHWIIPLLFGAKYADATTLVVIRAVAVPIGFAQMTYSSLFISRSETARKVLFLGITAAVSVVLNVLLVGTYGVVGGAVTSVIAEAVLLILHMHGAARHIPGVDIAATLRPSTLVTSARLLLQSGAGFPRVQPGVA